MHETLARKDGGLLNFVFAETQQQCRTTKGQKSPLVRLQILALILGR